ncbi:MAG: poly(3-hydroxybutyrate) depolymerase [Negativicutes bacterium]|nr:poly(3-hydroxybutyrate) depolymerase [Negativicutes bacterium]
MDTKNEELLARLTGDIEAANRHYESDIEPLILERSRVYHGDKEYYRQKYPDLSEVSDLVSTDLADIIEWSMPSLMKAYFSGAEIVSIQGVDATDERPAKVMQELVNYQLTKLNKFFVVCYDWIKTAFIENAAAIKCSWTRETKADKRFVEVLSAEQLAALKASPLARVKKSAKVAGADDLFKVEFETLKIVKNAPRIENVPAAELRFSPEANDLEDCNFVAHRKIVTVGYLRKLEEEGLYQHVDEVVETLGDVKYTESELLNNPDLESLDVEDQTARRRVELYECYVKYDADGDQILEDWIVTMAGQTIIRKELNTYGRHPFFLLAPVRDPGRIWPKKGIGQFVSEIQSLKTAFLRQIINNTALNNDLPAFVDENRVNIMDVVERKKTIRVSGAPGTAVSFPPLQPMAPWTMQLLEYLESAKEQASGVTRYNQGLDASSLNKTATGISIIHDASNQRLELIARILLETGLTPLFRFIILLNQKFIDQPQVIRLANQPLIIRGDDLQGNFDLEINASLGVGSKPTEMQNIQMLLGMYPHMAQAGIVKPENVYNAVRKMLEIMGYKNISEFISEPPPAPKPPAGAPVGAQGAGGNMLQNLLKGVIASGQGAGAAPEDPGDLSGGGGGGAALLSALVSRAQGRGVPPAGG